MAVQQPLLLHEDELPSLPVHWRWTRSDSLVDKLKPGKLFDSKTVLQSGATPVLNQSDTGYLGFHDEAPGVIASVDTPVVTFANHTCAMRLMTRPFSSIQNVFPKIGRNGVADTVWFFYAMLGRVHTSEYKGHHPLFRDAFVPVPPLDEQRRIASILSAYDDLIENNTRRIAILEEMARRIYEEWFVHFRFPDHERVRMVESELGPVPEGWTYELLGSLLSHHIGGGWGKDEVTPEHSVPAYVIRGTDIPDVRSGSLGRSPLRYHTASNFRSRQLKGQDIVFEVSGGSKDQPVGRAVLVPQALLDRAAAPVICASFCRLVRADPNKILPQLLFLHFQRIYSNREIMKYQTQSTGITNFKFTVFIEKEVVLRPAAEVQKKFSAVVAPMMALVDDLGATNTNLRTTRDLLLPKLISGELDVSELRAPEAVAA